MGFEPNKITREHILNAVKRIKNQKIELISSTKYDVIIDGNSYPPKDLLRFAHEEMNGENIWENSGGEPTNNYLENLGFVVKPKKDLIFELVQKYKSYIANTKMQDEVYKWDLVKKFKGRPDTNADDFANEYKSIKFGNLLYQLASGVGNHICREKPEEFRQLFVQLFNENTPLNDRVNSFNVESLKLYRSIGGELGHHQDERSISTYLTLHNPEKYTFYKSTFYKEFCKLMNVAPASKNEKYGHYLELLNQFIENYIVPDTELTDTVKSYISEYYDGTNNLLLAQDILYCMLNKAGEDSAYWVFQGNPTKYDFQNAIKEGSLTDWTASAHRDKFKIGDKVIFWLSGKDAGCYALGEINTEPFENNKQPDGNWKEEDHSEWKVGIQITHNLTSNPIFKEVIDATSEFKDLKVGHQGTNFTATKEEYEGLLDIIDSGKSGPYNKIKRSLSSDKLAVFLQILRAFTKQNNLSEEDPRISFNIRESHSRLVFVIGGRYSLCIEKKKKETILSFISEHDLTNTTDIPFKNKKSEVEAYWNHFNFDKQEEFEKLVFEGLNSELQRNYHCNYKNFSNHEFAVDILGETRLKYWLYAPGENANMWEDFHKNGIMGLGWDELGDLTQYSTKEEITTRLKELYKGDTSKANDASANVDFRSSISIGDIVIAKKGRNAYLGYGIVTSDYYFDDSVPHYKHKRNVNWVKSGHWESEHSIALKTLTDITNLPYKPNPSILAHEAILNIMNDTNPEEMNHPPLNQILYGPPGTGKTFTLNKEYFSKYTSNETSLSAEQHFINVVGECSWWQVIAIALMQEGKSKVSALSENKWIKQKAALSNSNTIRPTLWGQLQSHTIEQCSFVNVKAKQQPFIFNKTEDSFWEILPEEVKENAPELLDLLESVENFKPRPDKKIERFVFTTFHQGYSYEDFIEGIKPVLEENDGQLHYQIEDGIFKRLCLKAESDPQNKYAIFIDEINRGNVSAIFGELITLIEADKRKGAANELSVILPYSKRSFSVPSNIDIYGTMNTADRSVEALDTALRRRFSFVEMLPDASKLENKQIEGIDLALLLNTLNERIEVLVDRDHTIGHAFFMNIESLSDLRSAFANKIVPLLQEYFYGNYRKMEMVIGSAFFNITEANKVKFAVKSDEFDADGTVYHIKNISHADDMSDSVFIEALNQLIKGA